MEKGCEAKLTQLIFVTSNEGKMREAKKVLTPYGLELECVPFQFTEPTSGTISEVALQKLQQVIRPDRKHVFVEDSGIFFTAYPGFPGVLSKRVFLGIGYHGIQKLLEGERKEAWFQGTVALYWDGEIRTFSGITEGRIVHPPEIPTPEAGFPFDPIFIPTGEKQVMQKLSQEQRLKHSYRACALQKMADWIDQVT